MVEIILKLVWAVAGERLAPLLRVVSRKLLPALIFWFSGLPFFARGALLAAAGCTALGTATLGVFGSSHEAAHTAHEFAVAESHSQNLDLAGEQGARARLYAGIWSQLLIDRYDQQLKKGQTGKVAIGETTWTVGQKMLALNGLKDIDLHPQEALDYLTGELDPDCGCWRGFRYGDHKESYPVNVVISAWIITGLERTLRQPQPAYAEFLKKTQLQSGAWPMLRSNSAKQGSTAATPWAILALMSLQASMPEDHEIAAAIRRGVNWLLDNRQPNGIWTLYPLGTSSAAHKVSLSNSGLAIVALHQALQAEAAVIPEAVLAQWKLRVTEADRELLRRLKPGVAMDESESYNDQLPTI